MKVAFEMTSELGKVDIVFVQCGRWAKLVTLYGRSERCAHGASLAGAGETLDGGRPPYRRGEAV